MQSKSGKMNNY